VIAEPLSDIRQEEVSRTVRYEENELLKVIKDNPQCDQVDLARRLGWLDKKGEPQRYKVSKMVKELKKAKLADVTRAGYLSLTKTGEKCTKEA
jgi:Mn-dependent DtxR family transcriptional regulator